MSRNHPFVWHSNSRSGETALDLRSKFAGDRSRHPDNAPGLLAEELGISGFCKRELCGAIVDRDDLAAVVAKPCVILRKGGEKSRSRWRPPGGCERPDDREGSRPTC